MNVYYILDAPKDISWATLLYKTCPVPIKIIGSNFHVLDQYGWVKRKGLLPDFNEHALQSMHDIFKDDLIDCKNLKTFMELLQDCDVCMGRGREFVVIKCPAKKHVSLSLNRSYLGRAMDVMPYYKDRFKLVLPSKEWMNPKWGTAMMENYSKTGGPYHTYEEAKIWDSSFRYVDILGDHYNLLYDIGRDKIREELGLPLDKKIALFSFRQNNLGQSMYRSVDAFFETAKKLLYELKDNGYYIVCRRRLGKGDFRMYKREKMSEVYRFGEVEDLIDQELNQVSGFPGAVWKVVYASDLLALPDLSAISYVEGLITRVPTYIPIYEQDQFSIERMRSWFIYSDLLDNGVIFNELNDESLLNHEQNIGKMVKKWYNCGREVFWDTILE